MTIATDPATVPDDVLAAYDLDGASSERLASLINPTFLVTTPGGSRAIVQRLHHVFGAEVNLDIDAITARLEDRGLVTPRLLKTGSGGLWVERDGQVWRAQTFLEGRTQQTLRTAGQAHAAGEAVARFHAALDGFRHSFHFARPGAHDTAAHLRDMTTALAHEGADPRARELGEQILARVDELPMAELASQPTHLCHGDLKISNLRFAADGSDRVVALIDLDTLAPLSLAYELGDALRSWCNPHPEEGPEVELNCELFAAAMEGYASNATRSISPAELGSCVAGFAAVALELSSRFCRDMVEDRYFGWDPERFASRLEHNLARARSQLALGTLVLSRRQELQALVMLAAAPRGRAH